MIQPISFAEEHIRELQKTSKRDPVLLERAVYAFWPAGGSGRVGMPFIFKGGTCLMLLMNRPRRLSTDIDIIVDPERIWMPLSKRLQDIPFPECGRTKIASEKIMSKSAISSLPMIPR